MGEGIEKCEREREKERGGREGERQNGREGERQPFSNQYPFPGAVMLLREWLLHYQTENL